MQKQFFAIQTAREKDLFWWSFSCLFDVYLFIRLVDERPTNAFVDKIENYDGVGGHSIKYW